MSIGKLKSQLIVFIVLFLVAFSSCKKEETEPTIVGEWKLVKYKELFKYQGKVVQDTTFYSSEEWRIHDDIFLVGTSWTFEKWKFQDDNNLILKSRDTSNEDYIFEYKLSSNNKLNLTYNFPRGETSNFSFYEVNISDNKLSFYYSDLGPTDPNAYNYYFWLERI